MAVGRLDCPETTVSDTHTKVSVGYIEYKIALLANQDTGIRACWKYVSHMVSNDVDSRSQGNPSQTAAPVCCWLCRWLSRSRAATAEDIFMRIIVLRCFVCAVSNQGSHPTSEEPDNTGPWEKVKLSVGSGTSCFGGITFRRPPMLEPAKQPSSQALKIFRGGGRIFFNSKKRPASGLPFRGWQLPRGIFLLTARGATDEVTRIAREDPPLTMGLPPVPLTTCRVSVRAGAA